MSGLRYVYVAAPMSGAPAEYLANVCRMNRYARQLIDRGYCPINPAGDMMEGLASDFPLTDAQYKTRSMDLLRLLANRDDAEMHIITTMHRDGRLSVGVAAEVRECRQLNIPVVYV